MTDRNQRMSTEARARMRRAARIIPGVAAQQDAQNAIAQAQRNQNTQQVSPYEARRRAREAEALRQRRLDRERQRRAAAGQPY